MRKRAAFVVGGAVICLLAITAFRFWPQPNDRPGGRQNVGQKKLDDTPPKVKEPDTPKSDPAKTTPEPIALAPVSLLDGSKFLIVGDKPRQVGVKEGTIEARRVAVLRGQVHDRAGKPLSEVGIKIDHHPEFGSTLTLANGVFDLVVNGGGTLCVHYHKDGYLPVCRQLTVPWQDYAWLPDVVLIPVDQQVTSVDLTTTTPIQVVRGSVIKDDKDGERQATLLVSQGTEATMLLPDGTQKPLTSLSVRVTEYTVGPNGPAAMPAPLPPNSAYTYAVELTADEATKAGATDVRFSKPLAHYVENFLNFPTGLDVPAGYYDPAKGAWIASDNGRVVKIVGVSGGLAELDIEGLDKPADIEALKKLGVTDEERRKLANLYKSGQSLWRVPISHFSSWDFNWGWGPPQDAEASNSKVDGDDSISKPCYEDGSLIDVQNQILGEAVGIAGTPFRLHYQSDRVPGRKLHQSVEIRLSGGKVPKSLKRIELEVMGFGRRVVKVFPPEANQRDTFICDRNDAYGRPVQGQRPVTVRIGYVYDGVYKPTSRFGYNGNGMINASVTRGEVTVWREHKTVVGGWDAQAQSLGGWSLNVHHAYDPTVRVLYLGDGRRQSAGIGSSNLVISTIAGGQRNKELGDDGPATQAVLHNPSYQLTRADASSGLVVAPDGSLYVADQNDRIRRISPQGIITTFAGGGSNDPGDGGPATEARLFAPSGLALAPDGSLYISENGYSLALQNSAYRIRRIAPDGSISTIAGSKESGFSGDGGPAEKALISNVYSIALGPDGSLYLADSGNYRVRRIGPDGVITTVAGGGQDAESDAIPATSAQIGSVGTICVAPDGSLCIATGGYGVRRVGPDGLITTVLGHNWPFRGHHEDGVSATKVGVNHPLGLTCGFDGSLYVGEGGGGYGGADVLRVESNGIVTGFAGIGAKHPKHGFIFDRTDGGLAINAEMGSPTGLAVGPDGSVYVYEVGYAGATGSDRIRRIAPPLPGSAEDSIIVPSEDGNLIFKFNSNGRHLETRDAVANTLIYQFGYDMDGRLVIVEDGDGNSTSIERDKAGHPLAIIAPFGTRTELTLANSGYLSRIAKPAGEATELGYGASGLLATLKDPNGNLFRFTYDEQGRLTKDENPAGGFKSLARSQTEYGFEVALKTANKPPTTYQVETLTNGDEIRRNQCCCGAITTVVIAKDGTHTVTRPDGSVSMSAEQPDPRWGMQSPLFRNSSFKTPGGIESTASLARQADLSDPANPLSLKLLTDTFTVNGRNYTSVFDVAEKRITRSTPAKRQTVTTVDERSRVRKVEVSGLLPVSYDYDERGRLIAIAQGAGDEARGLAIAYDAQGHVASLTGPLQRTVKFEYDQAGRVVKQVLPDGREVGYGYDANGNTQSVTPPGRPAHSFEYTPVNLTRGYSPPAVGAGAKDTGYEYNLDKQLTRITRPDGKTVELAYDKVGHLETVTAPHGQLRVAFDEQTEQLKTLTAPDGGTLSFTYDGPLPTQTAWDGTIKGSVSRKYDNDLRVTSLSVNGAHPVAMKYDPDGLLAQAGALTFERDPGHGAITGTKLGKVATTQAYNGFGERKRFAASFDAKEVFVVDYERDALGRITKKTETIAGETTVFVYQYDPAGRLSDVSENGQPTAHYEYDSNGNRLKYQGRLGNFTGTYDAQDRLLTYGDATYTHTANGEWATKTENGQTTTYDYDALGNLRSVALPDGTKIEYVIDAANRRVGKKVNGKLVQGFLYEGQLRLIAELDGEGKIVSRFIYGTQVNVPEYMERGGKTYRLITDHLGSPRLVIDVATGEIAQRMDYDEFGNVLQDSNLDCQPFGFAGGIRDPQSTLARFGARDFDPATARWMARDPFSFGGGDENLFVYVFSDPLNLQDANGLDAQKASDLSVTAFGRTPWGKTPLGQCFVYSYLGGRVLTELGVPVDKPGGWLGDWANPPPILLDPSVPPPSPVPAPTPNSTPVPSTPPSEPLPPGSKHDPRYNPNGPVLRGRDPYLDGPF